MKIVRFTPANWMRFRSIRRASLLDAPDAFGSTVSQADSKTEADWQADLQTTATFVAVANGKDIGIARGVPDHENTSSAYLVSMWVAPEHRGQRIGERLINAVVNWGKAEGFSKLILDVADENHAAIALYSRMGFEPNGITGSLPPPREHILEHQRELRLKQPHRTPGR